MILKLTKHFYIRLLILPQGGEKGMCKINIDVDTEHVLNIAQELESRDDVKGVSFKYNSKPRLFK